MQDYIKPTKGDSDPSMHMLQAGTNDLSLEDIPKAIFERIIATAESLKNNIMK